MGFLTHLTWGVLSFPFKLVFTLIGTMGHSLIGTFTALILFIVNLFGFFTPQPSMAASPTVSVSPTVLASTYSPQTVFTNASSDVVRNHEVTLKTFSQIEPGMSYEEVKEILGDGEELSRSVLAGTEMITYQWESTRFTIGNMIAMFENDSLISKTQFGLK